MYVETNFLEDVRAQLGEFIEQAGYDLPQKTGSPDKDAEAIFRLYWNTRSRRISARPRKVHWSTELRSREPSLPSDQRSALREIERAVAAGDDLTPRLSRKVKKRDYHDGLLNDWGIHHLHLGRNLRPDGLVEGGRDVLFVMVREDDAYFIDVRGHFWTDQEVVEIVHVNWPAAIASFRVNGVSLRQDLTPVERKNLRDRNANAAVQMPDGTVYMGIGGGMVASGLNARAVVWTDRTVDDIRRIDEHFRSDGERVRDIVERETGVRLTNLVLFLHWDDERPLVEVCNASRPLAIPVHWLSAASTPRWTIGGDGGLPPATP